MQSYEAIEKLALDIEDGYRELRTDPNYKGNNAHGSWVVVLDEGYLACTLSCVGHKQSGYVHKDGNLRDYMQQIGIDNHPSKSILISLDVLKESLRDHEWVVYPKKEKSRSWWDTQNISLHSVVINLNDTCELNPLRIAEIVREIAVKVKNS